MATTTAMLVFRDLLKKGYHPIAAAGIAGNFDHETDGFKAMRPYDEKEDSYGYAHWNGPRKAAFLEWSKSNGLNPRSHEANMGYLNYEMQGQYAPLLESLNGTNDLKEATRKFMVGFERPAPRTANLDSRYRRAQDILDQAQSEGMGVETSQPGQTGPQTRFPTAWPTAYPASGGGSYPNSPMPGQYPNSPIPKPPVQDRDKQLQDEMIRNGMRQSQQKASLLGISGLKYANGEVPGYQDMSTWAMRNLGNMQSIQQNALVHLATLLGLSNRR